METDKRKKHTIKRFLLLVISTIIFIILKNIQKKGKEERIERHGNFRGK